MKQLGTVLVVLCAVLASAAPAIATSGSSTKQGGKSDSAPAKHCKDRLLLPKKVSHMARVQKSIRCLVNHERVRRGLSELKQNSLLQKAADWQATDMLQYHYFDHARIGGPIFADRILRFGYGAAAPGYEIGENIAWASAPIMTPQKMVKLWMDSPQHRSNILSKRFRDQAVSALWAADQPVGDFAAAGGPYVILVNQFGRLDRLPAGAAKSRSKQRS